MNTFGIFLLNPLLSPSIGLMFWTLLAFITVLILLKKFAWKPILGALKEREESIQNALDSAKKAREEIAGLKADNEKIVQEAKIERDKILKEARELKETMLVEAKQKAQSEGEKLLTAARESIQNEKMAAITELKNQVASLSIEIAEKILKEELKSTDKQKTLISNLLQQVNMN